MSKVKWFYEEGFPLEAERGDRLVVTWKREERQYQVVGEFDIIDPSGAIWLKDAQVDNGSVIRRTKHYRIPEARYRTGTVTKEVTP